MVPFAVVEVDDRGARGCVPGSRRTTSSLCAPRGLTYSISRRLLELSTVSDSRISASTIKRVRCRASATGASFKLIWDGSEAVERTSIAAG